ncbi:MAG: hypothetical protein KTR22_13135 [Flavobacteriaceae bacterium]|nr:hypothetical protein [Flavobacteriaceae bacterium]
MKTLVLLACLTFVGCNSTQSTTGEAQDATEEIKETSEMEFATKTSTEMQADGYQKGVVLAGDGKEGSCAFVIDIKGGFAEQIVDPTNLDDSYKTNDQKIWLKFRGLRMMNRCPEARPVEITEIFARKE